MPDDVDVLLSIWDQQGQFANLGENADIVAAIDFGNQGVEQRLDCVLGPSS
jgi:hypothetical protein